VPLNPSEQQGAGTSLTNRRVARIALAILVGLPVLFVWRWQIDRWRTDRAIRHAVAAGEKALAARNSVKALIAFNHARELRPSDPALQRDVWRARALLVAESADRVSVDNAEDVRFEVEQLIDEGGPDSATYLTALAHVLQRRGDTAGARARLDEAIKANPQSVIAHLALADMLQHTSDKVDDAIREYQAALAADPNDFAAHYGLSRMYLLKRDSDKELSELNKAVAIKDDYNAWESLGDAYLHAQKLTEAAKAYGKAAQLNPSSPEPHWGIGTILSLAGEWPRAEQEIRIAMRGKRYPEMSFQLGLTLARQGKCPDAVPLFLDYLHENPTHAGTLMELGSCAAALGQRDNAIGFYQKVLALPLPQNAAQREDAEKRRQAAQVALSKLGVKK